MITEYILTGTGASPGIAIGRAMIYRSPLRSEPQYREAHSSQDEIQRLDEAIAKANALMMETEVRLRAEGKNAEAHMVEEHRTLLNGQKLRERAMLLITASGWRAAEAIVEAVEQEIATLIYPSDPYLQNYAANMRDIAGQVQRILNQGVMLADQLTEPAIVIAEEPGLSEWMYVPRERLLGFALAAGGSTSHSIILARSLGIPTIIGLGPEIFRKLHNGVMLALDGTTGQLVVMPSEITITDMQERAKALDEQQCTMRRESDLPSVTCDNHHVVLLTNAATVMEAQAARTWGAQGIGSLRTELLFLGRPHLPNEEEQMMLYNAVAAELPGLPIVARTLDIGGDKYLPAFPLPRETNPFLGWRGIRIGLSYPEKILIPQLRAMLRSGATADIRIVFPMIATIGEFRQVKKFVEQILEQFIKQGIPCNMNPKLGVMIEIPAAAIAAEHFARECDFLSIGTNDLIQYTLACDRTNRRVGDIYQPLEPAILHLIHQTVEAAHRYGKKVSVCGEMASDPALTPLLIGLGVDELSCIPRALPLVRSAVRQAIASQARALAQKVLQATSREEVQALMEYPT